MADCVVQNDGTSLILLNDGSSCILLAGEAVAGVTIKGTHATQLIGPRAGRLDPVEFTFWLKSELLIKIIYQFRLLSTLLRTIQSNIKLKASLLVESLSSLKLKSTLLIECIPSPKSWIKSSLLIQSRSSFIFKSNIENKKLKKVLLRKLREFLDEDG